MPKLDGAYEPTHIGPRVEIDGDNITILWQGGVTLSTTFKQKKWGDKLLLLLELCREMVVQPHLSYRHKRRRTREQLRITINSLAYLAQHLLPVGRHILRMQAQCGTQKTRIPTANPGHGGARFQIHARNQIGGILLTVVDIRVVKNTYLEMTEELENTPETLVYLKDLLHH